MKQQRNWKMSKNRRNITSPGNSFGVAV